MARIISRSPQTREARTAKVFDSMRLTILHVQDSEAGVEIKARFDQTDGTSIDYENSLVVQIDVDMEIPPRLVRALENLSDLLGRFYTRQHLDKEIRAKDELGENATALRALRAAVDEEIKLPVSEEALPASPRS